MASVRKFENSKGTGYIIDYYDTNGKRHRLRKYCSREEAEALAQKIEFKKSKIGLGLEKEVEKVKLFDAIEQYIDYSLIHKAESTIEREKRVYKPFKKFMGNRNIRRIKLKNVERYVSKRYNKDNLKPASIGIEVRTLKAFFNYLIRHELINKNPVKGIAIPKNNSKGNNDVRYLSIEEVHKLLSVIDSKDYKDLVRVYLHTGARRKELLTPSLTWDDIDFANNKLILNTKGGRKHTIIMDKTVTDILYRRKHKDKKDQPFDLDYERVYRKIKGYYKKAGIKNANVHTLRKTFGSLLVQQGVPLMTVSKLLGHSSVKVTESHYAELLDRNLKNGVKKLDDII